MKTSFRISGKSIAISVALSIILTLLASCASNPRSAMSSKGKPARSTTKTAANITYTITDEGIVDDEFDETIPETPKPQIKTKVGVKNNRVNNNQADLKVAGKKYANLKIIKNNPDKQEMLVEIVEVTDPILSTSYQDQVEIKQKLAKTSKFAKKGQEEDNEEAINEETYNEEPVTVPAVKNTKRLKTLHQQVEATNEETDQNYTAKPAIKNNGKVVKDGFKKLKPKQENIIILTPNLDFQPRKKVAKVQAPAKKPVTEEESYEEADTSLNEENE